MRLLPRRWGALQSTIGLFFRPGGQPCVTASYAAEPTANHSAAAEAPRFAAADKLPSPREPSPLALTAGLACASIVRVNPCRKDDDERDDVCLPANAEDE